MRQDIQQEVERVSDQTQTVIVFLITHTYLYVIIWINKNKEIKHHSNFSGHGPNC